MGDTHGIAGKGMVWTNSLAVFVAGWRAMKRPWTALRSPLQHALTRSCLLQVSRLGPPILAPLSVIMSNLVLQ